jgi:predicted ATPase with chaperone activity
VPLAEIRERILRARTSLESQFDRLPGLWSAAEVEREIDRVAFLRSSPTLEQATSLRARHKLVRVASTLAALEGAPLSEAHVLEASGYRTDPQDLVRINGL